MNAEPLFLVRHLRFAYNRQANLSQEFALAIDDLRIEQGEFVAFVGGNGVGKTTLLKLLNGLIRPNEGAIDFRGFPLDPHRLGALRTSSVLVHQQPYLFVGSVYANVAYGLKVRHADQRVIRSVVPEKIALMGLDGLAARRARTLSGGEKQRVAIARALALEPEVLLLDEPTAHMDPGSIRVLEGGLRRLHQAGTTVIMSSHQLGFAYRLADRIEVMDGGRTTANRENVFKGQVSHRAGGFLHFHTEGGVLRCPDQEGNFGAAVLSENDVILSEHAIETSAQNQYPGRVTSVHQMGHFIRVELDCGILLRASITEYSRDHFQVAPGRKLIATFKASAVRLY